MQSCARLALLFFSTQLVVLAVHQEGEQMQTMHSTVWSYEALSGSAI